MQTPPLSYDPGSLTIQNGDPTLSLHALEVDRASTWAACRKRSRPVLLGVFKSGQTYELTTELPTYTQHFRVWFRASGWGSVAITASSDPHNAVVKIHGAETAKGAAQAQWIGTGPPATVIADGTNRSLGITLAASPSSNIKLTFTITDHGASNTLELYAIRIDPLYPAGATLP